MTNGPTSMASWSIHSQAREEPIETPSFHGGGKPFALLGWLDNYFRATPEDRMRAAYLAYWN